MSGQPAHAAIRLRSARQSIQRTLPLILLAIGFLLPLALAATEARADAVDDEIARIQADIRLHGYDWTAGRTRVMELPPEQRRALLGARLPPGRTGMLTPWERDYRPQPGRFPTSFSWLDQGMMTAVKDQQSCGSCWAFAAIGVVEAHIRMATGIEQDLSEQQGITCGQGTCTHGGWADYTYDVVRDDGSVAETCMPYAASDDPTCDQAQCDPVDQIQGYYDTGDDVASIKAAVLLGPVSTYFTVYPDFESYTGGCYQHFNGTDPINHVLVICGWDDNACNGQGAWLVKNSWGTWWGLHGYGWVKYGNCNIGYWTEQINYTPLRPVVVAHTPLPDTDDPAHDYTVRCDVSAYLAPLSSVTLYYRLNGGDYAQASLAPAGGRTWTGSIPRQPVGTTVDYYLEAQDAQGRSGYSPRAGNGAHHSFHVVFFVIRDRCEQIGAWTAGVSGDDAIRGKWELGDPIGTTWNGYPVQPDTDTTPSPGVNCFVTGAASLGCYNCNDVTGGTTTLLSGVYDLSPYHAAHVSFDLWYVNHVGPGVMDDSLRIDASSDAGSHWVGLYKQGRGDLPGHWERKNFDLGALIPLTSQVRLRFRASDTGAQDVVEAAVDEFAIGAMEDLSGVAQDAPLSAGVRLDSPRPNPAGVRTALDFSMPHAGPVSLGVYSPGGRLEIALLQGVVTAGEHQVWWNGRDAAGRILPSGIYYVRLRGAGGEKVERVTLLR